MQPARRAGQAVCVLKRAANIFPEGAKRSPMRPKKIILCVDDNEQDLSVLAFMLSTNGYRVLAATTGQEAIAMFGDHLVDLVLTDSSMPQMTGDQLIRRLKQLAAHVPMVL